jgi:hypothetical protein
MLIFANKSVCDCKGDNICCDSVCSSGRLTFAANIEHDSYSGERNNMQTKFKPMLVIACLSVLTITCGLVPQLANLPLPGIKATPSSVANATVESTVSLPLSVNQPTAAPIAQATWTLSLPGNLPTVVPVAQATVPSTNTPPSGAPAQKSPTGIPSNLNRYFEPQGGFSFVPPDGWQMQELPGLKFKIASGPTIEGHTPSIVFVDETFDGSLDDYVKASLVTLQRSPGFLVVTQDDFQPDEGGRAVRLVTDDNTQQVHQTFYFFNGPTKKFVITCTHHAGQQETVDAACDQSMKTFRFESPATSINPPSVTNVTDSTSVVTAFFNTVNKGNANDAVDLTDDGIIYTVGSIHEIGKDDLRARLVAQYVLGWKYTLSNLNATGPVVTFTAQVPNGPLYRNCTATLAGGKIAILTCQ